MHLACTLECSDVNRGLATSTVPVHLLRNVLTEDNYVMTDNIRMTYV